MRSVRLYAKPTEQIGIRASVDFAEKTAADEFFTLDLWLESFY